ncbi:hypothetical protein GJ496_002362 [Pomphorhynchus laevis]|nr:hypothetical protein GJ496_002362 [Pomphorhynchus laevis]
MGHKTSRSANIDENVKVHQSLVNRWLTRRWRKKSKKIVQSGDKYETSESSVKYSDYKATVPELTSSIVVTNDPIDIKQKVENWKLLIKPGRKRPIYLIPKFYKIYMSHPMRLEQDVEVEKWRASKIGRRAEEENWERLSSITD